MRFSLVTTCYNEIKSFPKWKDGILSQTRQPDEICIVDAVSSDGTTQLLTDWAKQDSKIHIKIEKSSVAKGRNIAVAMSTGEVIVSTDMGCQLDENWFKEITRPFEDDPEVQVVAGNYGIDMDAVKTNAAWADYYLVHEYKTNLDPGIPPSNRSVAYRRKAWEKLGGLPEDLTCASDDTVMGLQLFASGMKVAYAKDAYVYWSRYEKLSDFWKQTYKYGYGDGEAKVVISTPTRLIEKGWPWFVVFPITVLSLFWGRTLPILMFKAFKDGRFGAMILIPIHRLGTKIAYCNGFRRGYKDGAIKCQSSRQRVADALSKI